MMHTYGHIAMHKAYIQVLEARGFRDCERGRVLTHPRGHGGVHRAGGARPQFAGYEGGLVIYNVYKGVLVLRSSL